MGNILDKWEVSVDSHFDAKGFKRRNLDECDRDFGFRLICHINNASSNLDMDMSELMMGTFYDYMTIECGISKENLQEKVVEFFNDAGLDDLLTFYAVPFRRQDFCKYIEYRSSFTKGQRQISITDIPNRH